MTAIGDETLATLVAGLTDPQREAVTHAEGPLLILAGPGSGKTRVVTRRAAYLARTVTSAEHVLAITFTNKAANEMRERVVALTTGSGMTVSTFHAFGARLLRVYHERADIPRNFTIFDREDRRKVLKEAIDRCELGTNWTPARIEAHISNAKNALQTAADYAELEGDWVRRSIARVYQVYEGLLRELGGLDFDDLLMKVATLLAGDRELRDRLEDRYRYVLVDEYQDTNAAQYLIARLLAQSRGNICVTGDPDQSIYSWRGADIENILRFERDFPNARVVRLEQNYRSTQRILAAADALIAINTQRKEKSLWTENDAGPRVRVIESESGNDEAKRLAEDIQEQLDGGVAPGDIAVFYRINSLSRPIEEALFRAGVQYQIARGVEFYNRTEIKDVLAYLRVMVNPADEVSLLRIINTPSRGIGSTTVQRLVAHAREQGRPLAVLLQADEHIPSVGRSAAKVADFGRLLRELAVAVELPPVIALEKVLSESGLRARLKATVAFDADPLANIDELISAAAEYQKDHPDHTLVDWLEHTALVADVDAVRGGAESVTLMTLHAAKGLEFPCVYIVGLEEGMLPFSRGDDDFVDEEEERRLCFVGMTRAMRQLTLSHVKYRMIRGQATRRTRSQFLAELPKGDIEWHKMEGGGRSTAPRASLPPDIALWQIGTLVTHPDRGLGQITSFRRGGQRTMVSVKFQDGTDQAFTLEFANLTRVDFDEIGEFP